MFIIIIIMDIDNDVMMLIDTTKFIVEENKRDFDDSYLDDDYDPYCSPINQTTTTMSNTTKTTNDEYNGDEFETDDYYGEEEFETL